MPSLASFSDPKVYHILTYGKQRKTTLSQSATTDLRTGTLLGGNIFQTFMGGPIAFKALPRPSFSQLQQAIFPPFFAFHTVLPVILALTWPGEKVASASSVALRENAGWQGMLGNFWDGLVPVGTIFLTGLVNLVALGPATTRVMKERKHQETRDGKKYYDPGPKSPEMQRLNTSFMRLHGASSTVNLISLGAMIYYGAVLAEKI